MLIAEAKGEGPVIIESNVSQPVSSTQEASPVPLNLSPFDTSVGYDLQWSFCPGVENLNKAINTAISICLLATAYSESFSSYGATSLPTVTDRKRFVLEKLDVIVRF